MRGNTEQRHGFDLESSSRDRAKRGSLFFDGLLKFNSRYAEAGGELLGKFRRLHTDIYGNREFVDHLRSRGNFFACTMLDSRRLPRP